MICSFLAVIAGYAVFAISAVILFSGSGIDPHGAVAPWFMLLAIVYGMLFAALGGYLAAVIARRKSLLHSGILTIIIAAGALTSLLSSSGKGAIWSQLAAIFLMAPSALIGGYLRMRQSNV